MKKQDEALKDIIAQEGTCRLTIEKQWPYLALLQAIAGQQLHTKAAQSILTRLKILNGNKFPVPEALLDLTTEQMRQCGFSFRKIESLRALALATLEHKIPTYQESLALSNETLMERLIVLPGVGRWTIEMFLIFTLGRMDVMPIDDFGIREGWRICKKLVQQPKPKILESLTYHWSPYRSIGAWYLWRVVESLKTQDKQNPLTR